MKRSICVTYTLLTDGKHEPSEYYPIEREFKGWFELGKFINELPIGTYICIQGWLYKSELDDLLEYCREGVDAKMER